MTSHELPLSMFTRPTSLLKILDFMMIGAEQLMPFITGGNVISLPLKVGTLDTLGFCPFLLDFFYKVGELAWPHSFFNLAPQFLTIVSVVSMVFMKIAKFRHVSRSSASHHSRRVCDSLCLLDPVRSAKRTAGYRFGHTGIFGCAYKGCVWKGGSPNRGITSLSWEYETLGFSIDDTHRGLRVWEVKEDHGGWPSSLLPKWAAKSGGRFIPRLPFSSAPAFKGPLPSSFLLILLLSLFGVSSNPTTLSRYLRTLGDLVRSSGVTSLVRSGLGSISSSSLSFPSNPCKWMEGLWRGVRLSFSLSNHELNQKYVDLHVDPKSTSAFEDLTGFVTPFVCWTLLDLQKELQGIDLGTRAYLVVRTKVAYGKAKFRHVSRSSASHHSRRLLKASGYLFMARISLGFLDRLESNP
nr:hypothetical protein [Tanacetum cinerariifolium]